jgi:hypothetical protein
MKGGAVRRGGRRRAFGVATGRVGSGRFTALEKLRIIAAVREPAAAMGRDLKGGRSCGERFAELDQQGVHLIAVGSVGEGGCDEGRLHFDELLFRSGH